MTDKPTSQDFVDLQRELSGAGDAKASRFLNDDSSPRSRQAKNRKAAEREQFVKTLLELLNDPTFKAAYDRVTDEINDAQERLNEALDKVAERIEHLLQAKADLEDRAAKLDAGTAIFKSQNGKIYTADGREISASAIPPSILAQLDNGPSWEQYQGTTDALNGARQYQNDLFGFQGDIDDARTRRDDAKSVDDLNGVEKDIEKIFAKLDVQLSSKSDFNNQASTFPEQNEELDFSKELSPN